MATWHQQKARVPLWHASLWGVVTDPPNGCTSVMRFDTAQEAEAFLPKAGPHSYVLRPSDLTP